MVDLFFMFLEFGPAIKLIFEISYIPNREDFKELTPDQYKAVYAKMPEEELKTLEGQKVLAFLPDDPQVYSRLYNKHGDNLMVVGSEEVSTFERVAEVIERYCENSKREFKSLTEKLVYMAEVLPDVFSKDTPYALHGKIRNLPEK